MNLYIVCARAIAGQLVPQGPSDEPPGSGWHASDQSLKTRTGFVANAIVRSCLAGMLMLLATGCVHPRLPGSEPAETSIPLIASIGKIQIGYSTQEDLERNWGPGKTIIGGHPNSGRLWRVRGTPWVLKTDGFEYSRRGLVVDSLSLSQNENDKADEEIPFARLESGDLAWLGDISLGMTETKVKADLERIGLPVEPTQTGFEMVAEGHHSLVSYGAFRTWTVSCGFTNGILNTLQIDAYE